MSRQPEPCNALRPRALRRAAPSPAFAPLLALIGSLLFGAWSSLGAADPRADQSVLQLLESRLPAGSILARGDLAESAPHYASDRSVDATFAALLAEFLAPPSTSAAKAPRLVQDLCALRPAQVPLWVGTACAAYLQAGLDSAEDDLIRAVASGTTVSPAAAPAIVRAAIERLAAATESRGLARPPLDPDTGTRQIGRVVATSVTAVSSSPQAALLIRAILAEALRLAREQRSATILVESLAATVGAMKDVPNLTIADLARFAFTEAATTKESAGLICAAILRGAGAPVASSVKDQAALTLSVPFASFVTLTSSAFIAITEIPDQPGSAIARSITVTNADFIPALMIGGIVGKPAAATEILLAGLNRDMVLHGRSNTGDILFASLLAAPSRSAELAAAAVGRGDLEEGNQPAIIAEAVARAAPHGQVAAALTAQLRAQRGSPEIVRATVAGALSGSTVAGRVRLQAGITQAIASASGLSPEVLEQALASAPRQDQSGAILGVLAADPARAPALLQRALHHPALDRSQTALVAEGGALLIEMQQHPRAGFSAALRRLAASPESASALLLAAALANPRGLHAIAAAFAIAPGALAADELRSIAAQGNRGFAAMLEPSVTAALAVAADEAAAFRFIRRDVALHPAEAADIIAGAAAARPALAPVFGEAAASAAPGMAGALVRSLFAFSGPPHPLAPADESASAHAAALTSSVLAGVLAARLDEASESAAVSDTVANAVRSIFALARIPADDRPLPTPEILTAVIDSAARAAPTHLVEIARATARVTRALAGSAVPPALIERTVLAAAPTADPQQIAQAVATGSEDAERRIPAANGRALSDYSYDSLTGPALTRYLDL